MFEIDSAPEQEEEEIFDFSSPEDVLIKVVQGDNDKWGGFSIDEYNVINRANPSVTGAASYEMSYAGFLDYTIEGMIDPPGEGWFVVEGMTGYYSRGDGYTSDDDMEFYYEKVRPATEEEIKLL